MRRCGDILVCVAVAAWLAGCGGSGESEPEPLRLFAAASTTDVLQTVARRFEEREGRRVICNFAASSTLARQVIEGASADVLVSAHPQWMDRVEDAGRVVRRVDLLGNRLVLVTPEGRTPDVRMTRDFSVSEVLPGKIAVGDPAHVPAGMYGREALKALGWWASLRDRVVRTRDVRSALALVSRGEVAAGVVYATDARITTGVAVAARFPEETHRPIRYPAAVCDAGRAPRPGAVELYRFLRSDAAAGHFEEAGFIPLASSAGDASS